MEPAKQSQFAKDPDSKPIFGGQSILAGTGWPLAMDDVNKNRVSANL
jgi:hypothetical protein